MSASRFDACPVRIRGVIYPSQRAAARAFGVNEATIRNALDAGRIDEVGLVKRPKGGRPGKPCVYRGKRYPSITAAARDCGVSTVAIWKAIKARDQLAQVAA